MALGLRQYIVVPGRATPDARRQSREEREGAGSHYPL